MTDPSGTKQKPLAESILPDKGIGEPEEAESGRNPAERIDLAEGNESELQTGRLLAAIAEEKANLASLINSISDEIWFADMQGKFTLANPAACKEFQLSGDEELDIESFASSLEVLRPDGSVRPILEAPPLRALKGEVIRNQEEIIRTPLREEFRYRQVSSSPVKDSDNNIVGSVSVVRDITELRKVTQALEKAHRELEVRVRERTAELTQMIEDMSRKDDLLAAESQKLQETNIALKVLLQQRERDRLDLEMNVRDHVRKLVSPYLERLKATMLTPAQESFVNVVATNLEHIISPLSPTIPVINMAFTPREIEVAHLVKEGKTAKEIALLMNLSNRVVEFHKENIRKKLNLTHTKTNLRTYLLSTTQDRS